MAGSHDDDHHHHHNHVDPPSFPIQTTPSILSFLVFFLAYYLSHHTPFAYVENDTAALAAKSARGEPVAWSSFDKHFVQSPKAFFQPNDKGELLEIVRQAREENHTMKVVGSGHSWSPLGLTPGYMINIDKLNRVLEIDAGTKRVRVEAGIRIRDLSAALAQHDPPLALKNTGVLNRQSLGGALATGTHGTGVKFPIMSDALRGVEIVTSSGAVLRASKDDPDPGLKEVFEAATIHLGALGVVTEMELEVVDAFSVYKRTRLLPLEEVLAQLSQLAHESDHVLMWWIPYTDTVQLLESNRTARGVEYDGASGQQQCVGGQEEEEGGVWGSYARMLAAWLRPLRPLLGRLQVRSLSAAGWLSSLLPIATVPFTNKWLVAPALHAFAWGGEAGVLVPEGHKGICLDDHPDQYREAEYFLPPSRFPQAFARFRALLEEHKATLGANFVVQLRMTARDDLWLSPFRGDDDWYMSIATLVKGFDADPYFQRAEAEVWLPFGGKPHWGKLHYLGHNELSRLYGEPFEKFLAVRRRLDPTDMFLNAHLRDLFLPRASK